MASESETLDGKVFKDFMGALYSTQTQNTVLHNYVWSNATEQPSRDQMNFISHLMTKHNVFPDFATLEEAKSDVKSEEYRKLGNIHFSAQPPEYVEALKEYNKSMCFAVSPGNVSTALSNRSAVFFKMEMFRECLESIRLAREVDLPENLREKLERREEICRDKIRDIPQEEVIVPVIGMPVNEKIPFIAKCLELRENKKLGRHIITMEDIPAGTIIAMEEAYCKVLVNAHKYIRCTTCLAENPHLLLPCDTCTQAMFCSKTCKEKGLKEFHSIECPISGSLLKMLDFRHLLTFRLVVRAFLSFPDTQTLREAMKKMEKEKKTVFNFDWRKELSPEQQYTTIHTLSAIETKKDGYKIYQIVSGCLMFRLLKTRSSIFNERYLKTRADEDVLKNLIMRHFLTSDNNRFALYNMTCFKSYQDAGKTDDYGSFIANFSALINHSCCSNTRDLSTGNSLRIVAVKNIAAGEQICKNYNYHFTSLDRKTRQKAIQSDFGFLCKCLACAKGYPTYTGLPYQMDIPEFEVNCPDYSTATTKREFERVIKYIRKYGKSFPTRQLVDAEAQIIHFFKTMHKDIPIGCRERLRLDGGQPSGVLHQHNLIKSSQSKVEGVCVVKTFDV